ncbi:MAG: hypothetical protein HYS18_02215 [Burkholderiales bacterium]|nr:hypothetical protein [Burkholderiales bacterium]
MQRVLSLDQAPALSIPLRFFLTAPFFAILASLLIVWQGQDLFVSRWSPGTLALTHLLTLGFLAMTMIGALIQILHVVAGVALPQLRLTASATHVLLTLGTLLLCAAFLSSEAWMFKLAILILPTAFVILLAACVRGMRRLRELSATVSAIRMALMALAITILLGASVAAIFAWQVALPLVPLVNLHAGWGLLGWVGLLIVGVAYQVLPMFQVTPLYPAAMTQWLARSIFGILAAGTLAFAWGTNAEGDSLDAFMLPAAVAYLAFAIVTLRLLKSRKRPPDATTYFWVCGMIFLAICGAIWMTGQFAPHLQQTAAYPLLLGVLFIAGFVLSIVNGMLYKIVPFLVWYHLQNQITDRRIRAPNVRDVISEPAAFNQFCAHLVAVLMLTGAVIWPEMLARPAGLALGISSGFLGWNLLRAASSYRQFIRTHLLPSYS